MANQYVTVWFCVFGLFSAFLISTAAEQDKRYFLQMGENPKLVVATLSESPEGGISSCKLYNNEEKILSILNTTGLKKIEEVTDTEMRDIIDECREVRQISSSPTDTSTPMSGPTKDTTEGYDGWNVIFPGTKWCGAGDVAKNYDDLGIYADTDKCCRAHDLCNDTLAPGQTKYNLTNSSPFTKLSCKCDNDFYDCLDKVDSLISNKIGNVYFNILKRTCYENDYPKSKRCKTYRSFLKITCKEYARNTRLPKSYQWKPARLYKKLPIPGPFSITIPSLLS